MFVNDIFKKKQLDEGGPFRSTEPKKPRKGSVADLAAQKRKEQEKGKQPIEPKDQRVGIARVTKDVAEGISVVDQDYDLDQMHLTLDIEGKKVYFTYWNYEEDFSNAERKDVFDQLQEQPWYKGLDHPTKMEILDAAYRAIRGLEPQEYRPTVGDEPLDEQGLAEGLPQTLRKFVPGYAKRDIDKKMDAGKFGRDDVAKDANYYRYKKIQDKIKEQGVAEGLNEFAPTGGGGGRWYSDDQLYDIIGEDWLEAFDVSGDRGNIDLNGERARIFLAQEAEAWLTDRGYRVNVLDVRDDGDELSWYIQGPLYKGVAESSAQEKLHKRHQELRKKSGLPDPDYYKELKASYDLPDTERYAKQKEIKQKYKVTNEDREQYIEELGRAGYEIVTEKRMTCPECGGAAYSDQMLAEKQDACYHKVKSRYKVWPSAYASGALVRCRKKGAKNWGNKSKK